LKYLVDGHNLISKLPGLSLSMPDDEQRLIEVLRQYCLHGRHQVEVFFDAAPPGQAGTYNFGQVTAHFVRQGQTADDAIRKRLASLKRSAKTRVVVTSDRSVQAAAREAHASVVSSEDFVTSIRVSAQATKSDVSTQKDEQLSEAEIQEWMAIFKERPKGK
jgi:predicted RNA-binding protein with PIN domain